MSLRTFMALFSWIGPAAVVLLIISLVHSWRERGRDQARAARDRWRFERGALPLPPPLPTLTEEQLRAFDSPKGWTPQFLRWALNERTRQLREVMAQRDHLAGTLDAIATDTAAVLGPTTHLRKALPRAHATGGA